MFKVELVNEKEVLVHKAQQMPLVRLKIGLNNGYPCESPPRVEVIS